MNPEIIIRLESIKKIIEHTIELNRADLVKLVQQEDLDYNAINTKLLETFGAKQRVAQLKNLIADLKQLKNLGQ